MALEGKFLVDNGGEIPEQGAIIAHFLELVLSTHINTFPKALCLLEFVQPVVVPHGNAAHDNPNQMSMRARQNRTQGKNVRET